MKVGVLVVDAFTFPVAELVRTLAGRGYETGAAVSIGASDLERAETFLDSDCDAVVVCGRIERFLAAVRSRYAVDETLRVFTINDKPYALCDVFDRAFIEETVIPVFNSKCRTFYTTARFRTFGHTEAELRELLKEQIKNRNRIAFDFYPSRDECDVEIRYSSKTARESVDEIIAAVSEKLKDCIYSLNAKDLPETVADLLKIRGKKLCLAESFTGGGIAAALTRVPGASSFLYEGIVCYSPLSKAARLGVDKHILDAYGAVSIETVYEMAAGLLMSGNCDTVVATTGNAGPTAEKEGDEGHCFIAVGNEKGIHIYEYRFTGSREEVIESGVKHALFRLYKKLRENEFEELLKAQAENS